MGISTQIGTQPSLIPEPDPFVPGQVVSPRGTGMIKDSATGKITYFGTPAVAMEQPVQPEKLEPPDPYIILENQLKQKSEELENEFAISEAGLLQKPKNRVATLEKEFEIQYQELNRKYLNPVAGETVEDQQKRKTQYNDALASLRTQKQIAAMRIMDKVQPEHDMLMQKKQQAAMEIQRQSENIKVALDTIKKLGDAGQLEPTAVLQQQLQEIGIEIPLSQLKPPTPQQQLREIDYIIGELEDRVDMRKFVELGLSPDMQQLEVDKKQLQKLRLLRREKIAELFPQYAEVTNRVPLAVTDGEVLTENKGGTIGTLLRGHGTAAKVPAKNRIRVVSPDGVTGTVGAGEIEQFLAQGYRRI